MNPTSTFIKTMSMGTDASVGAALALLKFAERNRSALTPYIDEIAVHFSSPNLRMRAITAEILGAVNTLDSLRLLDSGFRQQSTSDLTTETEGDGSYGTLASILLYAMWKDDRGRSDELHRFVANFMAAVVCHETYPTVVKASAMKALSHYIECNFEDEVRGATLFPKKLFDVSQCLASHEDPEVSSEALKLIALISHRIAPVPKTESKNGSEQRIDFVHADMRAVMREFAPFRFVSVHPQDFEIIIAKLFSRLGYEVEETAYVGDFGADLIASKANIRIAVQVKRYSPQNRVGVGDVNQVIGAMRYYQCDSAMVVTTSDFTAAAQELAKVANVGLCDWKTLMRNIEKAYGVTSK